MLTGQYPNEIIEYNTKVLEEKKLFKLICGASLTDFEVIKGLSLIYSLSGANIIDVAATKSAVDAAKAGIKEAKHMYFHNPNQYPYFNEPVLMISVNSSEDPHFKTAVIDNNLCDFCQACKSACVFNAIALPGASGSVEILNDLCYGCGKCIHTCPKSAISLQNNIADIENILTKLIDDSITGIEIHTGTSSVEELQQFWQKIINIPHRDVINNILFSFSLESSLYSSKLFVEYTKNIINMVGRKPIIQIDGTPMSGNISPSSSLQSLASAQVLLKNNVEAYLILAGGINHLTRDLISLFEIDCHGIAMGTFARKLVWPYLKAIDNKAVLHKAIRITTNLV